MRRLLTIIMITTLFVMSATSSFAQQDEDMPERNSLEVNAFLTMQFPTYPDVEAITANAYRANLVYWIDERGKALIRGEDLPRLTYSTTEAPGDLKALTVVVDGMPGTTSVLDWTAYPTITFGPVELRMRAYDKAASALGERDRPIVDIILSDLTLSTEEVCAEGVCTAGYLDAENLEAQIVFTAVLPEADYPPYQEWLAGRPILGELRVRIPNPFAKK